MASTRLVVIEDEQAIRRGISDALRASGYEIAEAADGVRGLEAAARAGVDLVLLDLMLPRRDGLDVLTQLRKLRPSLPVIILTARGSEDDRVRGLRWEPTTTSSNPSPPANCSPASRRCCAGRSRRSSTAVL